MDIDLINVLTKSFCMSAFTMYILLKILNYKVANKVEVTFLLCIAILMTGISIGLKLTYAPFWVIILNIMFQTIIFSVFMKRNIKNILVGVIISNTINYFVFLICCIIEYGINLVVGYKSKLIPLILSEFMTCVSLIVLFKMRKLKNGLDFLLNKSKNDYFNIIVAGIAVFCMVIYIFLYTFLQTYNDEIMRKVCITFIITGVILLLIIQKVLTMYYKQKLIEQTIKEYEKEIKEKDDKIKQLADEKYKISKLNHEFYNRQKALMLKVEDALANMNFEAGQDIDLKDKIQALSNEYAEKSIKNRVGNNLHKTEVEEIDDMFAYMNMECKKFGIEFILQVNGNINFLVNNYIDKSKLVTLIGDHLRDAIIAINYSKNKYKSILAILGIKDDNYEFCIYDSGIEFSPEILDRLGLKPVTTHSEDGGSGIGFVTTFETLKETKASFILEELNNENENSYTKAIKFVFDNKSRLEIHSYRALLLKDKLKTDRFIIR